MRTLLLATALAACAPADGQDPVSPNQADAPEAWETANLRLASVDTGFSTVHFDRGEGGTILVSELIDGDHEDVLDGLIALGATPLEMFLSLSDQTPPQALVDNHDAYGHELDAPVEARVFDLGDVEMTPPPAVSKYLRPASCRYASDRPWFDGVAPAWTWRWYVSSNDSVKFTPNRNASVYYTHLCNYTATGGTVSHCLTHTGATGGTCNTVSTGRRSIIFAFGDQQTWYAFNFMSATGNYKLGAISP